MAALLSLALVLACSNAPGIGNKGGGGNVTLTVSDPATCGGAGGIFTHLYVTISDVQLSPNLNALPGDSSFVDLTPSLRGNPVQVDLLGTPTQCLLATLGSSLVLPPADYRQIRVFLSAAGPAVNQCGLAANCVVLTSDPPGTTRPIQLSQEVTQGIEIPASRITGGKFTAVAGQSRTLNLNFDGCSSVVALSGTTFRFRPALVAGDSGSSPASITGNVVDSATQVAIANGIVIVALERPDSQGVDRVVMQTQADAQGNFTFCPVQPGTYEVVATAVDGVGNAFAAAVTVGVQPGNNVMNVQMNTAGTPATISGLVSTQNTLSQPTSADVSISALQSLALGGVTSVTVPLVNSQSSTATIATGNAIPCPPNTNCAGIALPVPAANPSVALFRVRSGPVGRVFSLDAGD